MQRAAIRIHEGDNQAGGLNGSLTSAEGDIGAAPGPGCVGLRARKMHSQDILDGRKGEPPGIFDLKARHRPLLIGLRRFCGTARRLFYGVWNRMRRSTSPTQRACSRVDRGCDPVQVPDLRHHRFPLLSI